MDKFDWNWPTDFQDSILLQSEEYHISFDLEPLYLLAFKNLLEVYLQCKQSWPYSLNNRKEQWVRFITKDIHSLQVIDSGKMNILKDELSNKVCLHVCVDVDTYQHLFVVAYVFRSDEPLGNDVYNVKLLNEFAENVSKEIMHLVE